MLLGTLGASIFCAPIAVVTPGFMPLAFCDRAVPDWPADRHCAIELYDVGQADRLRRILERVGVAILRLHMCILERLHTCMHACAREGG
jgi:hypothetical protein